MVLHLFSSLDFGTESFFGLSDKDKQEVWQDLHRLIIDKDDFVRGNVATSIGSVFFGLSDKDKQEAWQDLHRLMTDVSKYASGPAVKALKSAFPHVGRPFVFGCYYSTIIKMTSTLTLFLLVW